MPQDPYQTNNKIKKLFSYIPMRTSPQQHMRTKGLNAEETAIFDQYRAEALKDRAGLIKKLAEGTLHQRIIKNRSKNVNEIIEELSDLKGRKIFRERFKPWLNFLLGEMPTEKEESDFFDHLQYVLKNYDPSSHKKRPAKAKSVAEPIANPVIIKEEIEFDIQKFLETEPHPDTIPNVIQFSNTENVLFEHLMTRKNHYTADEILPQNAYHPDCIQFSNFTNHLLNREDLDVPLEQLLTDENNCFGDERRRQFQTTFE